MFVADQRIRHVQLAHNDEGGAISQRPLFVRVPVVQIERAIQPFAGGRNDFAGSRAAQMEDETRAHDRDIRMPPERRPLPSEPSRT
jgi:hypothetical protein